MFYCVHLVWILSLNVVLTPGAAGLHLLHVSGVDAPNAAHTVHRHSVAAAAVSTQYCEHRALEHCSTFLVLHVCFIGLCFSSCRPQSSILMTAIALIFLFTLCSQPAIFPTCMHFRGVFRSPLLVSFVCLFSQRVQRSVSGDVPHCTFLCSSFTFWSSSAFRLVCSFHPMSAVFDSRRRALISVLFMTSDNKWGRRCWKESTDGQQLARQVVTHAPWTLMRLGQRPIGLNVKWNVSTAYSKLFQSSRRRVFGLIEMMCWCADLMQCFFYQQSSVLVNVAQGLWWFLVWHSMRFRKEGKKNTQRKVWDAF